MASVLHIITGLNVGGAERTLHTLLTEGLQDHFDNHVISLTDAGHYGPFLREAGVPVACLNMSPGRPRLGALQRLRRAIQEAQPDLVQGWMYHGNLAASVARRFAGHGTRLAWNIRTSREGAGTIKTSTNRMVRLGRWLSSGPEAIIYNAARSRLQHEAEGYARSTGNVIPNGFDMSRWRPDAAMAVDLKEEFVLPRSTKLIGFVGRAHAAKDLANLFSAFSEVAARDTDCHLVCVGQGLEGLAPGDLDRSRVGFLGQRFDIEHILPEFDLFCLSSYVESFPNVLGEAMACGVPCVTTDVGDAADIVGETGWIVPPRDSHALAGALLHALALTEAERQARSLAARQRIEARFSLPSVIDRYVELYTKLLGACQCAA